MATPDMNGARLVGVRLSAEYENRPPDGSQYLCMERFWRRVQKTDTCWFWLTGSGTYGWFSFEGKALGAHRMSWILAHGPIPKGMCVLHHCDIPRCVRPDHLFLGTHSDNMRDMWAKGRGGLMPLEKRARGERHGMARL